MEILEVSSKEYATIIRQSPFIYASFEFNDLNAAKCDSVHYLLFREVHYRLGIIGGIRDNTFLSPFSAPFGGFTFLRKDIRIEYIDKALDMFLEWAKIRNLSGINIILPPFFYNESRLAKSINCFYRKSFKIDKVDLNYYFKLENFDEFYINRIRKEARNNLKKSLMNHLILYHCDNMDEKIIAYDIIRQNKELRGYPLYLTFDQIIETSNIVECDFFLVRNMHAQPIASAIVFHVSSEIVQIIYWGDIPVYNNLRTMNFLSYKLFEYYKIRGRKIVDLGSSTKDSVPNFGLCAFKESIGCEVTPKFSFSIYF